MHTDSKSTVYIQRQTTIHFETRLTEWEGDLLQFRQLKGRGTRHSVWEIWVKGDVYYTRHGRLDGKMQETSKRGLLKNKGKAHEISADQDALAMARRLARKKWDYEGYDQFIDGTNIDNRDTTMPVDRLLSSLPSSFSLYKPLNTMEGSKTMVKKAKAGKVRYVLKRNGLAFWIVVDGEGTLRMYSRRNRQHHKNEGPTELDNGLMDYETVIPWTTRFPHLLHAVHLLQLPPNTMMACELVSRDGDTKRHFAHVSSVEKSLTARSLTQQTEGGWLGLYWWDIPFYDGEDLVTTMPVGKRHALITHLHGQASIQRGMDPALNWIQPLAVCDFANPEAALDWAKDSKFEGWVVVDPEGVYGDRGWNLNGKPDRPGKFCVKLKPWFEDDFVVKWDPDNKVGSHGKGKHEKGKSVTLPDGTTAIHGGVGSVGLFQYNAKGELVYISDCSGMEFKMQANLRVKDLPQVWEVKFVDRSYVSDGDDTNALTFASHVRVRTDKTPRECVNDKL